jgi:hypothetical protein
MAEVTTGEPAQATAPVAKSDSFFKRQLAGTSFLSLEHFMRMTLVVVTAALLAAGAATAISLWTDTQPLGTDILNNMNISYPGGDVRTNGALAALGIIAALVVVVPLLVVLDRRTRAEWAKRPGFSQRVAYKLPVYGALALLLLGKLAADIAMLTVVLRSLAYMGVNNAPDIGSMYLTQFVPALAAAVIFGAVGWYVFRLAKGKDTGGMLSNVLAVGSLLFVIALLITAFVVLHGDTSGVRILPSPICGGGLSPDYACPQ